MKAIELIAAERKRQIEKEGYSLDHDDQEQDGDLGRAASAYAMPDWFRLKSPYGTPIQWPWEAESWKPTPNNRIRELIKAGALIVAEIERLQRLEESCKEK